MRTKQFVITSIPKKGKEPPVSENFTRTFVFDQSTKNKHRFKEVVPKGAVAAVGTFYVSKAVCPADITSRNLRVQVEFLTEADVAASLEEAS